MRRNSRTLSIFPRRAGYKGVYRNSCQGQNTTLSGRGRFGSTPERRQRCSGPFILQGCYARGTSEKFALGFSLCGCFFCPAKLHDDSNAMISDNPVSGRDLLWHAAAGWPTESLLSPLNSELGGVDVRCRWCPAIRSFTIPPTAIRGHRPQSPNPA